jgi:hypothetical protein
VGPLNTMSAGKSPGSPGSPGSASVGGASCSGSLCGVRSLLAIRTPSPRPTTRREVQARSQSSARSSSKNIEAVAVVEQLVGHLFLRLLPLSNIGYYPGVTRACLQSQDGSVRGLIGSNAWPRTDPELTDEQWMALEPLPPLQLAGSQCIRGASSRRVPGHFRRSGVRRRFAPLAWYGRIRGHHYPAVRVAIERAARRAGCEQPGQWRAARTALPEDEQELCERLKGEMNGPPAFDRERLPDLLRKHAVAYAPRVSGRAAAAGGGTQVSARRGLRP